MSRTKRRKGVLTRSFGPAWLDDLADDDLLDLRMCDLGLTIEGTPLEDRISRLYGELEAKGLSFKPNFWLSDEWFTPDVLPGVAIPFYLAYPRLIRLEQKQMFEAEGATEEWCMRILRHETGHAIDNAYRLRRRKRWREVFGPASQPYPTYYRPKPYSKKFVLHLEMWYAQSHPTEDFAETFAVWLKPRSTWRRDYEGWPALRKLEFVDELMGELAHERPKVVSRERIDPIRTIRTTLREHYEKKRRYYAVDAANFYDEHLRRLFSDDPKHVHRPTAAGLLRKLRHDIRQRVAYWTGQYQYTIDQVLNEMIDRCRVLRLRLRRSIKDTERDAIILVTMETMNHLTKSDRRVAM